MSIPLGCSGSSGSSGGSVLLVRAHRDEWFRWSATSGTAAIDLPGDPFSSEAFGVSGDGSIVVGHANMGDGWVGGEAFLWDETGGMQNLPEVLIRDYGLGPSLEGWTLQHAEAISADGRVIVGYGSNPSGQTEAWRAVVPEPRAITLLGIASLGLLACAYRSRSRRG